MSNVVDLNSRRPPSEEMFWNVFALCLACGTKWIGTVPNNVSLFKLECPHCGNFNSFATFVPDDYVNSLKDSMPKMPGEEENEPSNT